MGRDTMSREMSHYHLEVLAGPGLAEVTADVKYYDGHGEEIGQFGATMIAFATTWKDVAQVVREGEKVLGLDRDPVSNVSPMVDLS
jgi:hypothetical protein